MKKLLSVLALAIFLSGCGAENMQNSEDETKTENSKGIEIMTAEAPAETTAVSSEDTEPEITEEPKTEAIETVATSDAEITAEELKTEPAEDPEGNDIPEVYEPTEYEYEYKEHSELIEFEKDGPGVTGRREGYSGGGTVTAEPGGAIEIKINVPSSQLYNITLRIASDEPARFRFGFSGSDEKYNVETLGNGEYESVEFDGIYLTEGANSAIFEGFDAPTDLDCLLVESNEAVNGLDYAVQRKPVTEDPLRRMRKLYEFLRKEYGLRVMTAQHCSQGSNAEIEAVYNATGKYPAIRFGELMGYSSGEDAGDIELAKQWWDDGGIVGYSWYWEMGGSLYLENGFDLRSAVIDLDIATMDGGALRQRYDDGDVPFETLMVVDGIDQIAIQLKRLREDKIPVIFRPLPEAGNGLFWWGADAESYIWLYKLIFDRLTYFHKLDSLIWVWNGQNRDFYPGDERVDIVSVDLYGGVGSGVNFMLAAKEIAPEKMAAITECDILPGPDEMSRDRTKWAFAAVYSGIRAEIDGEISERYMKLRDWKKFYRSEDAITRDSLGDWY